MPLPPSLGSEEESGAETRKKPLRTWNHHPLLEKPCELFLKEARKFRCPSKKRTDRRGEVKSRVRPLDTMERTHASLVTLGQR